MSTSTSDTNVSSAVEELSQQFDYNNLDSDDFEDILSLFEDTEVDLDDVVEYISDFISYGVTNPNELRNAVVSKVQEQYEDVEIDSSSSSGGNQVSISSINEEKEWVTIVGEIVQLFDNDVDSILQTGLIDDGDGVIKFTIWKKSGVDEVSEGMVYKFEDVITSEYEGDYSVEVNSQSEITSSDEDITTSGGEITFSGNVVSVHSKSGLIARDEDDNVVDPSDVDDYEDDLRLMATIDNGDELYTIVFGTDETEDFTGIDLESATEMAMEAIDRDVVRKEMVPMILGKYLTVTGPRIGNYLYVEEYEQNMETESVDELLVKARTLSGDSN